MFSPIARRAQSRQTARTSGALREEKTMMEFDEITKLIDDAVGRARRREGSRTGPRGGERSRIPLTIEEWLARDDLAEPDRLIGEWFTTTSRVLRNEPTGIG